MLGTLNNYVAFFLKASRLCKLLHNLISKEYSGVQSIVFITTRKDQPCFLRANPSSGATRGEPPTRVPKNFAFFELLQKRELSHKSIRPQERPKAQGLLSHEITYASEATVPPLTPTPRGATVC
jgi:hypothetical protein